MPDVVTRRYCRHGVAISETLETKAEGDLIRMVFTARHCRECMLELALRHFACTVSFQPQSSS